VFSRRPSMAVLSFGRKPQNSSLSAPRKIATERRSISLTLKPRLSWSGQLNLRMDELLTSVGSGLALTMAAQSGIKQREESSWSIGFREQESNWAWLNGKMAKKSYHPLQRVIWTLELLGLRRMLLTHRDLRSVGSLRPLRLPSQL
jgi:hypothetical protein